jgi:imidazolonepropionase-like amidohydrolase
MHTFQSDELRIRADVLGNLEALRSATTIAADIVELKGKLGVIQAGAIADVLVVDGNPLKDIGVLTGQGERLAYVLQRGEVVSERGVVASR